MPELVANGPDIPVGLLNQLDNGSVVFFCGAGISATRGSDLPGFGELVEHVYEANHVEPDAVEREALDLDEADVQRRRPSFDKALGLLERRLGTQTLRETVISRLSKPATGELVVHRALIDLSRRPTGVRLITTNFDGRFVEAGVPESEVDAAPKLPVPRPHSWSSVVHLHGRILSISGAVDLVLTAADFGRAYLTERWAARFVTEVFREFTVVFVGYSLGDPVMSYMVDALAAERAKGGQFAEAYAFAEHDGKPTGIERTRDAWGAKNVSPLLYDSVDDHSRLAETLVRWAEIRSDPFQARAQIALSGVESLPAGADDPLVERVIWALDDPTSAQALANASPVTDEADFRKIAAWLERFSERGLLTCSADATAPAGSDQDPAVIRLVDTGFLAESPQTIDSTRAHLARWIANHLHVPQVLSWVLANGGHMHPVLSGEVRRQLAGPDVEVPARLRLLWTTLLDHKPIDHYRFLWTARHHQAAASDAERLLIEEAVLQELTPQLVVRPGPAPYLRFEVLDGTAASPVPLDECGHLVVMAGDADARYQVREIFQDDAVLRRHAVALTAHLEQALSLVGLSDEFERHSYFSRPSIAPHDQNPDWESDGWSHLIDLVRDSHLALARVNRAGADHLLERWASSNHLLFWRFALNALAEVPKSDIRIARKLLLGGRRPGLWEPELRREVLRFLRRAGSRLRRDLRVEVVRAIHAGPRGKMRKINERLIRHEKALRLFKLAESGALVDKKSRALAAEVAAEIEGNPDHREEFVVWRGGAVWLADETALPPELRGGSYRDVIAAIRTQDERRLNALVVERPVQAIAAVRRVTKRGQLTLTLWEDFLAGVVRLQEGHENLPKWRRAAGRALASAPDELFAKDSWAASEFVRHLADSVESNEEMEFSSLWTRVWGSMDVSRYSDSDYDDPLTMALNHPVGKLAEAALIRLSKHQPIAASGLPDGVQHYFNTVVRDSSGGPGRIMFATSLLRLHAIAPEWTTEHLLSRLDPPASAEARSLWSAYAASPRVGPNLLLAFKESFLEVLRGRAGATIQSRLTGLFMAICLEGADELTADEIWGVVDTMTEEALTRVLRSLKQRMEGDEEARGRIWRDRAQTWLEQYWPSDMSRNTAVTSQWMLDLVIEAGDAFPDAVDWCLTRLRPITDHGLRPLAMGDIATQHPCDVFRLVKQIVPENEIKAHQQYQLRELLDRLKEARPALAKDADFQRLYRLATR